MGQTLSASSGISSNDTSGEDISPLEQVIEVFVDVGDMLSVLNGSTEQR